jgi:uncharacterized protein YndB with AHSA1/START domain
MTKWEATMSIDQSENAVAVTRRLDAPASTIFAVLCDPANHVAIDGSGMLRSTPTQQVSSVGDRFAVEMWNDDMGEYEMTNEVVDFEQDRLIRWQPTMTRASRPEDRDSVGNSAKQQWGFQLTPVGDSVTDVTETFNCTESPEWLKAAVKGGEVWIAAMNETLDRLATQVDAP